MSNDELWIPRYIILYDQAKIKYRIIDKQRSYVRGFINWPHCDTYHRRVLWDITRCKGPMIYKAYYLGRLMFCIVFVQSLNYRGFTWRSYVHDSGLCQSLACRECYDYLSANEANLQNMDSIMMTSSNGNILRATGHLCGNSPVTGEFPSQRPVTWGCDVSFDLYPNKRFNTQSRRRWFETQLLSLWRNCNDRPVLIPN